MNKILEDIAKTHLSLETLETRRSDELDFHCLSVWDVRAALKSAYEAGMRACK